MLWMNEWRESNSKKTRSMLLLVKQSLFLPTREKGCKKNLSMITIPRLNDTFHMAQRNTTIFTWFRFTPGVGRVAVLNLFSMHMQTKKNIFYGKMRWKKNCATERKWMENLIIQIASLASEERVGHNMKGGKTFSISTLTFIYKGFNKWMKFICTWESKRLARRKHVWGRNLFIWLVGHSPWESRMGK